ncbi:MAG: hydantoinase/oxoprolinase family protein [Acidobacteriota bacterium]
MKILRIGIDTGGTFTDFVVYNGKDWFGFKVPSTPADPAAAILAGLARLEQDLEGAAVQHGSTVATNAVLERRGARCVLVTNEGYEDILEIGRQNRPRLYSLEASRPQPLVPEALRIGIRERTAWDGTVLQNLEPSSLEWLKSKIQQLKPEAVAVVLLYSFIRPESERRIAEALQQFNVPISLSHRIHPEFREYERTSTTVLNAYVQPVVRTYLQRLAADPRLEKAEVRVMQSNGGAGTLATAAEEPVRTLFSGPAAGVVGAFEVAQAAGMDRIITLDMGGTSTDVCLCDGRIETTGEGMIEQWPVAVQMIPIHSIGAGGGSIAWVDEAGGLKVGPRSAGADPGPVCYGKGTEVTVTDADLYLGRIDAEHFLGGEMKLRPERVEPALRELAKRLEEAGRPVGDATAVAEGIIRIVQSQMERAVRRISLQRGYDTRRFTLVAFGGAGPLHAFELAQALEIPRVLVPHAPGNLSAFGCLCADTLREASRSVFIDTRRDDWRDELRRVFRELETEVKGRLGEEGFDARSIECEASIDARYFGQSYEIPLPAKGNLLKAFHDRHQELYGYSNRDLPVEIVNARVRGRVPAKAPKRKALELEGEEAPRNALVKKRQPRGGSGPTISYYLRDRLRPGNRLRGPAVILEYGSTTWVPSGAQVEVDAFLNLVLTPVAEVAEPPKPAKRRSTGRGRSRKKKE